MCLLAGWRRRAGIHQAAQPLGELGTGVPVGGEALDTGRGERMVSIWCRTLAGTVATSQPSRAAVTTCSGWRKRRGEDLRVTRPGRSASTISRTTSVESTEMSSSRPMKQEM